MTRDEHQAGPQDGASNAAALAALMDPVALEARLAEARARRARALSPDPKPEETAPAPKRPVPTGFLAGLALGATVAAAALTPFLLQRETAPDVAQHDTVPVAVSSDATVVPAQQVLRPEIETALASTAPAVALLALRPQPRPADLRPVPTRSVSTRNAPPTTTAPQQAVLTALTRQGEVIRTTTDAGIRSAVRTVDRFAADLGRALPKPARKALREAIRAPRAEGRPPKKLRKD
jgi:hypothetical protein